ncbi:hypothetical protein DL93DRAFT_2076733, partial [Clavulina sp. PMI_390]
MSYFIRILLEVILSRHLVWLMQSITTYTQTHLIALAIPHLLSPPQGADAEVSPSIFYPHDFAPPPRCQARRAWIYITHLSPLWNRLWTLLENLQRNPQFGFPSIWIHTIPVAEDPPTPISGSTTRQVVLPVSAMYTLILLPPSQPTSPHSLNPSYHLTPALARHTPFPHVYPHLIPIFFCVACRPPALQIKRPTQTATTLLPLPRPSTVDLECL